MFKRNQYPKTLHIGSEIYRIKFVRKFKDKSTLAECDPSDLEIRIRCGQTSEETFQCFIHEILHALVEFENDIEIKHSLIYKLEKPLVQFIRDNIIRFHDKL